MQYMPSLAFQVVCFTYSAGLGFTLGFVYDLIKIFFFTLTGSDKKLVVVRDIIYVLVFTAVTFLFLLVMCEGRLLLYVFLAEAAGVYIYFYSLSKFIFLPLKRVIKSILRLFTKIKLRLNKIKTRFCIFLEKKFKFLHKITKKDLHIRHNIVYNFFVKLHPGSSDLKNRGDEDGKSEKHEN